MTEDVDAVVLGGGPAGATAALLLARAGWSVAVLERKAFPRRKVCGEYLSATNMPLLECLGIAREFEECAGPQVNRVGLFAGPATPASNLPCPGGVWGRALGRETLDTLLLAAAGRAGADVRQPCTAVAIEREGERYRIEAESKTGEARVEFRAPVVIAAHGSWEVGTLPTQPRRRPPRAGDLFGFKAHFADSELSAGLMPLLAFPGGYGGMVHCDGGRVSLSCCVRRDWLNRLHGRRPGEAGEAVLGHIRDSCVGVERALAGARRLGPWLAAGPIRPGIRRAAEGGIFRVGNAAGEAHPAVAEGISMAMQSAWLLAERLRPWKEQGATAGGLRRAGADYSAAWRRYFAPRLHASTAIAHWAMRPAAVAAVLPLLRSFPGLLTWGARFSGKAKQVV